MKRQTGSKGFARRRGERREECEKETAGGCNGWRAGVQTVKGQRAGARRQWGKGEWWTGGGNGFLKLEFREEEYEREESGYKIQEGGWKIRPMEWKIRQGGYKFPKGGDGWEEPGYKIPKGGWKIRPIE